jgi:hypothetical protein
MDLATIILIVVLGLTLLIVGGFFVIRKFFVKKYTFILHYSNGTHTEEMKVSLIKDPENLNQTVFLFSNGQKLKNKSPTSWKGNTALRDICINELGEYSYLKGTKFSDTEYKTLSLTPEEKSIALYRYKENANRYANPMDKMQAYMLFGAFFMAFIVLVGVIYSTVSLTGSIDDIVEMQKEINKGKQIDQQTATIMQEIAKQQIQIMGSLQIGNDLVRVLE